MNDRRDRSRSFEFVEHTADVMVRAYGATLEDAFAAAAEAMLTVITSGASIALTDSVEIEKEAIDRAGLLVGFLSELVVVHETNQMVLGEFDVTFTGECALRARCRGERFDRAKHGGGLQVKGVSYHLLEISQGDGEKPCVVQVLFDI